MVFGCRRTDYGVSFYVRTIRRLHAFVIGVQHTMDFASWTSGSFKCTG